MPTPLRVLIVEDSESDVDLILLQLRRSNYEPTHKRVDSEAAMAAALDEAPWEVVLCDYSMPQFDALAALRLVKAKSLDIPFIIVSGTIGEEVAVAVMKAGAHDYILKDKMTRLGAAIARELEEARGRKERARAEEALQETNLQLARALAELEQNQRRLVQQERLDALRQLAAGVVHELRNLVMPILSFTHVLLEQPERIRDEERVRDDLRLVQQAGQDVLAVAERLALFYRPAESTLLAVMDVRDVVREALSLTKPSWPGQSRTRGVDIHAEEDLAEVAPIRGNETELREVLMNLLLNAAEAMQDPGTITCSTRQEDGLVVVGVRDTGVGMSEATLRRCFEPFFTTKGERGSGMGLAIAQSIVSRHGGTIDVASKEGEGTTVTIRLPAWRG